MRKRVRFVMAVLMASVAGTGMVESASAQRMEEGANYLDVSFGAGGHRWDGAFRMVNENTLFPLSIGYERGIVDGWFGGEGGLGAGLTMGMGWRNKSEWNVWRKWDVDVAARIAVHYALHEVLDMYGGVQAGYGFHGEKISEGYDKPEGWKVHGIFGAYLGWRLRVWERLSVNAELGGGWHTTNVKGGVSVRIK